MVRDSVSKHYETQVETTNVLEIVNSVKPTEEKKTQMNNATRVLYQLSL